MYGDILLPTDGSEAFETVVDHAVELAADRDATVHVLYVVDDRAFLTLRDEMQSEVARELRVEGEAATARVSDRLAAAGIDVDTELRQGNPADEVLAHADDVGADLVVMGTHGADYERNMLGSVSQKVVTMADVPVLTVSLAE